MIRELEEKSGAKIKVTNDIILPIKPDSHYARNLRPNTQHKLIIMLTQRNIFCFRHSHCYIRMLMLYA